MELAMVILAWLLINTWTALAILLYDGGYLEGWALYVEFRSFDYAANLLQERGQHMNSIYSGCIWIVVLSMVIFSPL